MFYRFFFVPIIFGTAATASDTHVNDEIRLPRSPVLGDFECILEFRRWIQSGEERTKFLRYCEAPRIRNLVFSGGGAKGVAYAGVISALEEFQVSDDGVSVRDQIDSVSGSSAGAITAAFVAVGVPAEEFAREAREKDLTELLDSSKSFLPKLVGKSGIPMYEWIRDKIKKYVCDYALKISRSDNPGLTSICDKCTTSLLVPRPITFQDLRVLHTLNPRKFKRLAMIATDANTGRKLIFSWETFPDFEIALACRASASIPAILLPVIVPSSMLGLAASHPEVVLVDGGLIDNVPIEQATDPTRTLIRGYDLGKEGQDLSTLVFVFDESGETVSPFTQIHESFAGRAYHPKFADVLVRDHLIKSWIKAPVHNTVTKYSRLEDVRKRFTLRNVGIKVEGVKTTDFGKAKKFAIGLIENGRRQTLEYLQSHGPDEWIHESYDSAEELIGDLPEPKFQQLLEMGLANVFGAPVTRKEVEVTLSHSQSASTEECSYIFNRGGREVERHLGCLDDPEFIALVRKEHRPRRRVSESPKVKLLERTESGPYSVVLECFQDALMIGRDDKIGEYRTEFTRMSDLLDMRAVLPSENGSSRDRNVFRLTDRLAYSYSRDRAREVCEQMDAIGFWDLEQIQLGN